MARRRLCREDREALVRAVLYQVGNLIEFQSEYEDIADLDPQTVKEELARWMNRLPGQAWDTRLPDPNELPRGSA